MKKSIILAFAAAVAGLAATGVHAQTAQQGQPAPQAQENPQGQPAPQPQGAERAPGAQQTQGGQQQGAQPAQGGQQQGGEQAQGSEPEAGGQQAQPTEQAEGTGQASLPPQVEELQHYPIHEPHEVDWTFDGPFGTFDRAQLQRGFQVYRDVCAACHSLSFVAFRNLGEPGGPEFGEAEVRALAAEYMVQDGPNDSGEMFERPGVPADRIPAPYPNEQAARAANAGAYPPDLSLIAEARAVERGFPWFIFDVFTQYVESGPDYLYSLLTGYEEPPQGVEIQPGLYYNPYFISGRALAMPPPLSDGLISYAQNQDENNFNDVPETVDQYARDVTAFLMWAAEPKLEERKQTGFSVMAFLVLFAGLVYYTKKKVWSDVEY